LPPDLPVDVPIDLLVDLTVDLSVNLTADLPGDLLWFHRFVFITLWTCNATCPLACSQT
jgi:hypothetical protein